MRLAASRRRLRRLIITGVGIFGYDDDTLSREYRININRARHEWAPWRRIAKSVHGIARLVQRGVLTLADLRDSDG